MKCSASNGIFSITIYFVFFSSDAYLPNNGISEEIRHHEWIQIHLDPELTDAVKSHNFPLYLNLSFIAYNRTFSLILKQNNFLHPSYFEKHYESDTSIISKPSVESSKVCLYYGYILDSANSVVALSLCHHIKGMVTTTDYVYHIDTYRHNHYFITRDIDLKTKKCGFDTKRDYFKHPKAGRKRLHKRALHWPYDSDIDTRIVELYIVNDNQQYKNMDSSFEKVIQRSKETVNVVNSLYRPLNIYVILAGIEVWTEKDKITVSTDADKTMTEFLNYRRQRISPIHENDNAQLITGLTFDNGVVGKALKNTICSWEFSGGVNMDHSRFVGPVGTTMAHELGHNFGMEHDNVIDCLCPDDICIMEASSSDKNPTKWSSCSIDSLDDSFHQGLDFCLKNLPIDIYEGPICGNGIVENGESCDCGLESDCSTKCCDHLTCQLSVNSSCATGSCCDKNNCEILPAAVMCRNALNDCDLPEFCDGNVEWCPSDVHLYNGHICKEGLSYCYDGTCNYHEKQCQHLWGKSGEKSSSYCYDIFNVMGNNSGNCGFDWITNKFIKCDKQDVMCGVLFCDHESETLRFWREELSYAMPSGVVSFNGTKYTCNGAILDVGLDTVDPGLVSDGTKCGEKMMCIQQKCQKFEDINIPICPDCNGHGVCNSKGQCHCDVGYAPPFCKGHGYGGSLHSGPVKIMSGTNLTLLVCILFLVISLIAGFCLFYYRRKLKKMWDERPYRYDFLHRAKRTDIPSTATTTPVHIVSPLHSESPSRKQSFRGKDISSPQLQFCTKTQSFEKMVDVGIQSRALPPIPSVHAHGSVSNENEHISHDNFSNNTVRDDKSKPHPPRPAPPNMLPIMGSTNDSSLSYVQQPTILNANSVNFSHGNKLKPPNRPPPTYIESIKSEDITIPKLNPPPQSSTPPLRNKFQLNNKKTFDEVNSYENAIGQKKLSDISFEDHVYENSSINNSNKELADGKSNTSNQTSNRTNSLGNVNKKPRVDNNASGNVANKARKPSRPNLANRNQISSKKDPSPTMSVRAINSVNDSQSSNKPVSKPSLPNKPSVKKPTVTPKPSSVKTRKPVVTKPSSLKLKSTTQSKLDSDNKTDDKLT